MKDVYLATKGNILLQSSIKPDVPKKIAPTRRSSIENLLSCRDRVTEDA